MSKLYEIAFALRANTAEFAGAMAKAAADLNKTRQAVNQFDQQASQIGGILKQRRAVGEAARAYRSAAAKAQDLGRQLAQTAQPSKAMRAEFESARRAATRTGQALDKQRQALHAMERAAGTAGQELGQLVAKQRELAQSAEALRGRQKMRQGIADAWSGIKSNAPELSQAGQAIGSQVKSAVSVGMDFEKEMSRVGAVSQASAEDMTKLTAQARELGAKTNWSASQAAEGMRYLAMAGFKTDQILATMPGMLNLATSAGIDLGRAADISSNILTGFNLNAEEMGRVADTLTNAFTSSNSDLEMLGEAMKYAAPNAAALSSSIEQTAAMMGKMHDAGIQASQAGTAMRAMFNRIAGPKAMGQKALAELGVAVKDSAGNMRDYISILRDLQNAMDAKKMGNADQMAAVVRIFGTEASAAATQLLKSAQSGELDAYVEKLKQSGSAARVAAQQQDNLAGDIVTLKSAFEDLQITLYQTVGPALRDMAQGLTNVTRAVGDFMKEHPELVKWLTIGASVFAGLAAAVLPLTIAFRSLKGVANALKFAFLGIKGGAGVVLEKFGLMPKAASTAADSLRQTGAAGRAASSGVRQAGTAMTSTGNAAAAAQGKVSGFCKVMDVAGKGFTIVGMIDTAIVALNKLGAAFDFAVDKAMGAGTAAKAAQAHDSFTQAHGGADWNEASDADLASWAAENAEHYASGGIVSRPTLALVGEGGESEAILPLSRLSAMIGRSAAAVAAGRMMDAAPMAERALSIELPSPMPAAGQEEPERETRPMLSRLSSMLQARPAAGQGDSISVNFSPNIQITGQGGDAYAQASAALREGAKNLRDELARMLRDERRLAYF